MTHRHGRIIGQHSSWEERTEYIAKKYKMFQGIVRQHHGLHCTLYIVRDIDVSAKKVLI
jgi:hypothetical protein